MSNEISFETDNRVWSGQAKTIISDIFGTLNRVTSGIRRVSYIDGVWKFTGKQGFTVAVLIHPHQSNDKKKHPFDGKSGIWKPWTGYNKILKEAAREAIKLNQRNFMDVVARVTKREKLRDDHQCIIQLTHIVTETEIIRNYIEMKKEQRNVVQ